MSKISIPFSARDISAVARSLHDQLSQCDHTPGHLELLNMLARSTGHRNFQSLRAAAVGAVPEVVDEVLIKRLAGYFDAEGRLAKWPAKSSLQQICLWVIWSKLPARVAWTEAQLSARIRAAHLFGDHALLRRELCDQGLVARTADGREYRRVERRPPAEAKALMRRVGGGL